MDTSTLVFGIVGFLVVEASIIFGCQYLFGLVDDEHDNSGA